MLPASNYPPQAPFNRKNKSNTAWAAEKDLEKKSYLDQYFLFCDHTLLCNFQVCFEFVTAKFHQ